jgi:hypothetical protein
MPMFDMVDPENLFELYVHGHQEREQVKDELHQ